jgi:hypothetical protein
MPDLFHEHPKKHRTEGNAELRQDVADEPPKHGAI